MINKLKITNRRFKIFANQAGFTILESIVAIGILSVAISGVFYAVSQSLAQATTSKEEVKAFYLAQEAIDIIRNKRDENKIALLTGSIVHWLDGIAGQASDPCYFGKTCAVDVIAASGNFFSACDGGWDSCPYLRQAGPEDTNPYSFSYDVGNITSFRREVQLEQISENEIAVIVKVSWPKGRELKIKTLLLKWI